jgi:hypothetical protein
MKLRSVLRGARALALSVRAGQVDFNTASNRATICANCAWLRPDGGTLTRVVSWVFEWFRPTTELRFEPWTSRRPWKCGLCACSVRVKARLPLEFILRHTDPELAARAPEWCWWRKPLDAPPEQAQQ